MALTATLQLPIKLGDTDQAEETQAGDTDQNGDTDQTGNTDQPDETTNSVSGQLGLISIDQFGDDVSAAGLFYTLSDSFDLIADFNSQIETCEVLAQDAPDPDEDDPFGDLIAQSQSISAGEVITLTSNAGTYATLERLTVAGNIGYGTFSDLASPLPQNLTLDIPGDQFPAFSTVFPNVAQLNITPAAQESINADTTFQWTGSSEPFGSVEINAIIDSPSGTLDIFCLARDDGSFSFPADVRSQIGGGDGIAISFERGAFTQTTNGNATIILIDNREQ